MPDTTAATPTTTPTVFGSESISRSTARVKIKISPTTIARITYERGMLSAGVMSIASWIRKSRLGGKSSKQKIETMTALMISSKRAVLGGTDRMSAVSRMCSLRR